VAVRQRDFGSQPGFAGSVVDKATVRFFAQAILHHHWDLCSKVETCHIIVSRFIFILLMLDYFLIFNSM
jgi:hypothetical protein